MIINEIGERKIGTDLRRLIAEVAEQADYADYPLNIVHGANTWPDHDTLRCADFMIDHLPRNDETPAGNWIVDYLLRNRNRLGVYFLIWNRRVIRSYDKPRIPAFTWATYTGSNPHTDHVHLQVVSGYKYRPPGELYTVRAVALNARDKPNGNIVTARPRGFTIRVVSKQRAAGRTWAEGSSGLWYAADYLQRK
jgi:hypothetical protein